MSIDGSHTVVLKQFVAEDPSERPVPKQHPTITYQSDQGKRIVHRRKGRMHDVRLIAQSGFTDTIGEFSTKDEAAAEILDLMADGGVWTGPFSEHETEIGDVWLVTMMHPNDCDKCDECRQSAIAYARVTGSIGSTYKDEAVEVDGHRVTRHMAKVERIVR